MTGNLQMMMKFRDIQVAEDVGKKAELGWFDVEFTMYGCAYLERAVDKIYYKVSTQAEDIYDFIEKSAAAEIYPSNVLQMTYKCPVPAGMRETIAQEMKKRLAKRLQRLYPKEFFQLLYQTAEQCTRNTAAPVLWAEAEALEGVFDEERLKRFEALVQYSYSCRKIERAEYQKLLGWVKEERKDMEDDFVSKDIFEKTLYGIAYEENGGVKYLQNAQREAVYEKACQLEQCGVFVTPVYAKTYWYNYEYRLSDVISDYKQELRAVCNGAYREKIKAIRALAGTAGALAVLVQEVREEFGALPADTLQRYGYRWGMQ